jgi:hypothetical protein
MLCARWCPSSARTYSAKLRQREKDCTARLRCVGGSTLTTKYNRGDGLRTGVPGESNHSARVTLANVPARIMTLALARPGGGRAKGWVGRHDGTLASRTLFRRAALKGDGRDDGSRNGREVRITLLRTTDGESLVATVGSRAVGSPYQSSRHLKQSIDIGPRSLVTSSMERYVCAVAPKHSVE